jgi:hypothetical protein
VAKLRKLLCRKGVREELKEKSIHKRGVGTDSPLDKSSGFLVSATAEKGEAGGIISWDVYVKLMKMEEMESV